MRRKLEPNIPGAIAMRAARFCSKCLIWLAVLLSPVQMLQDSPLLCGIACSCERSKESRLIPHACDNQSCTTTNNIDVAGGSSEKHVTDIVTPSPSTPSKCPTNCWCWRSVVSHVEIVKPLRMNPTDCPAGNAFCGPSAPIAAKFYRSKQVVNVCTIDSALSTCAVLCRFLA